MDATQLSVFHFVSNRAHGNSKLQNETKTSLGAGSPGVSGPYAAYVFCV